MEILLLGASGLVGSEFQRYGGENGLEILAPTHRELDILDKDQLSKFIKEHGTGVVVNCVGFTNLLAAEKERGNYQGGTWLLNVEAAAKVARICGEQNQFLIHLSTDGVFPGIKQYPGPYPEYGRVGEFKDLSWYGYTKRIAEEEIYTTGVNYSIVRISHPFGNTSSEKDFAKKVIGYIKSDFVLFDDQNFTPTYLDDLSRSLVKIALGHMKGNFNVVCDELTTPYQFAGYISEALDLGGVKKGYIEQWTRQNPDHYPRVRFGGLDSEATQKKLGIKFHNWQEALDEFLPTLA